MRAVAAGVSPARFAMILGSRHKFSFFGLSSRATRLHTDTECGSQQSPRPSTELWAGHVPAARARRPSCFQLRPSTAPSSFDHLVALQPTDAAIRPIPRCRSVYCIHRCFIELSTHSLDCLHTLRRGSAGILQSSTVVATKTTPWSQSCAPPISWPPVWKKVSS